MIPSFFRLRCVDETGSTNDDVAEAARAGEPEGLVIQARAQTAGRGRQGRAWVSPPGNLYCSVLLRPSCTVQAAGLYTFAAGLAIFETVAFFAPDRKVEIKWPNDVLLDGGKVSGLLLETDTGPNGAVNWLVIGAGINVASCPESALYPTTCLYQPSLRATIGSEAIHLTKSQNESPVENMGEGLFRRSAPRNDKEETVDAILEKYLEALEKWKNIIENEGFEPLRAAWLSRAKGGRITARTTREEFTGLFAGLDDKGQLILKMGDGQEKVVSAADVFFGA